MNEENKCDIGRQLQDSLQCSASKTPLNNLDENIQIIILAEILLTKSNFTSKLNICVDHKEIILQNVSKRQRRKRCGIGDTPIRRFHHQGKGADRHVTAYMCSNIHQSIGVIIPVGTPICRLCRERVLENHEDDIDQKDLECSTSDLKRKGSSLDDLPPKRSMNINVSYASSQSSQTSQQLTGSQETEDSTVQQEERFEDLKN